MRSRDVLQRGDHPPWLGMAVDRMYRGLGLENLNASDETSPLPGTREHLMNGHPLPRPDDAGVVRVIDDDEDVLRRALRCGRSARPGWAGRGLPVAASVSSPTPPRTGPRAWSSTSAAPGPRAASSCRLPWRRPKRRHSHRSPSPGTGTCPIERPRAMEDRRGRFPEKPAEDRGHAGLHPPSLDESREAAGPAAPSAR